MDRDDRVLRPDGGDCDDHADRPDAQWVDVRCRGWVQWYVRPAADYTNFTMFPWVAFLFAGAAVGVLLAAVRAMPSGSVACNGVLGGIGALIVAVGFYTATLPTIYHPQSSFWTTSPTWFAIRVGVLMAGACGACTRQSLALAQWRSDMPPLERLGRSSLFVYWIHVELVYGYATWPLRHRLTLWQMAVAYALFCAAMYGALILRDRVVATWRLRRISGGTAEAVTA